MDILTQKSKQFPQARLSIFISGHPVLQGKYYVLNEKPVFLVNIDEHKLWTKFNGYSIANQILETFSKAKIRPLILYKYAEKGIVYQTTPSKFAKFGIPVPFGNHRQTILTLNKWDFFKGDLNEPYNLPSISVDNWLKPPVKTLHIDPEQKKNSDLRLKDIWNEIERKRMMSTPTGV